MMTAETAHRLYTALRLHFDGDGYDFVKYNGKTKAVMNPRDQLHYTRLSRIDRLKDWLVAQWVETGVLPWIATLGKNPETTKNWNAWNDRISNLPFSLKKDLQLLTLSSFISGNGTHPPLIPMLLNKRINLETFLLLGLDERGAKLMNENIDKNDPVVQRIFFRCRKYQPFLTPYVGGRSKAEIDEFFNNHKNIV